ncbi:MerR family DNA-binding protein [Microbacterium sp. CBS5P-1]|nr:MerR family DNA-binding protein [Microbacterium excoecariae]
MIILWCGCQTLRHSWFVNSLVTSVGAAPFGGSQCWRKRPPEGCILEDVARAFADVPLSRTPSHEDWQRASRRWKKTLEQRRRSLEKLEQELTGCIGCGCLSMRACTLLNPDDHLGETGAGARRIPL